MKDASNHEVAAPLSHDEDVSIAASDAVAFDLAEEVIRKFSSVRLRVTGTSMMPCMLPGDLVTVKRASSNEVSDGEIVLFKRANGFGLHRVVAQPEAVPGCALLTRGDRLRNNDPLVSSEALLGRVESIERNGRQFPPVVKRGFAMGILGVLLRSSDVATYLYLRLSKVPGKSLRDRSAAFENGHTAR